VTTILRVVAAVFPDMAALIKIGRAQEVAGNLLLLLLVPLILSRLHSIETGRRAGGPGLTDLAQATDRLAEGVARAKRIWVIAYNSSNFFQAFFQEIGDFKNAELSVLVRHPGASFIIPENPARVRHIQTRIRESVLNFGGIESKNLRVRGYFLEPVYRGFLLDEQIGFISLYKVDDTSYAYGRTFKYVGTGGQGWIVKEGGTPEERLMLDAGRRWFSAAWSKFSFPLLPTPTLVFDFDGTIADTADNNYETWETVLGSRSISFDRIRLREWVDEGIPSDEILEYMKIEDEDGSLLVEKRALQRQALITRPSVFYPEVQMVLEELSRRGYRMAIASSNSISIIQECLKRAGISELFGAIVDRGDAKKPSEEVLAIAAKRMGCTTQDLVFIGDSQLDAHTASTADVPFILVDRRSRNACERHLGLLQISNINGLLAVLQPTSI